MRRAVRRLGERADDAWFTVCDAVRARRVTLGPVVIVSASRQRKLVRNAFELGRDAGPRPPEKRQRHLRAL